MPDAAIPAATLIVLRDRPDGPPDILMVERSRTMAFAPGALVFPGGRIDPGDHALAADAEGAARVAAIRETMEEAGLLVGADARPGATAVLRRAIDDGVSFGDALAAAGAVLRPDLLVPFARWRPRGGVARIFDARFYLARAPSDAPTPRADGTENSRALWIGAGAALGQVEAGAAAMIFPTRRNVERLARFASSDEAFADAAAHPVRLIEPWVEERDGEPHLCIPEDAGYPVTAVRLADTARG